MDRRAAPETAARHSSFVRPAEQVLQLRARQPAAVLVECSRRAVRDGRAAGGDELAHGRSLLGREGARARQEENAISPAGELTPGELPVGHEPVLQALVLDSAA